MNFAQLRAFHAVAETGGVTRAAERLGVSQPAVTVQIRSLEETYGVELFHRINRRLILTALGEELLEIARRSFVAMDEAEALLAESGELDRGQITVGADGPYHVIAHLAAFREKFPGVTVRLAIGNSDDMLESLLAFRTDVAVLARFVDDPRLMFRRVARHRLVVFVPRTHAWGRRRGVKLADLDGVDMILREHGSTTRRVFEAALEERGVRPHVVMEIESREAVREAVAAGLGVGVVNEAEFGQDERLVALPLRDGDITTSEYVVCRADRGERRLVRAFLDLVGPSPTSTAG
jgi:aminoethylphosphonate catabolism LysR family transcriptional regulator